MITSAKNDWVDNPGAFVLVVESLDGANVFGGMRFHFANGLFPLPVETAVSPMDPGIFKIIEDKRDANTGESCGLWNSWRIAGYGIGSVFLSRAAMALGALLGATSGFSLCAPYTVNMALDLGMTIVESLGNKGTFYYPKIDLLTTLLVNDDLVAFKGASEDCRSIILELVNNPNEVRIEKLRKKEIEIHYSLTVPGVSPANIKDIISGVR